MTAKETKHKKRRPKKFVRITLNIITVLLVLTFIGLNVYLGYKILDKKVQNGPRINPEYSTIKYILDNKGK